EGSFRCPLCNREFAHSASLSRHRLNVHNGCHHCIQCSETISASTTLRSHFLLIHSLPGVLTCACCNWAFPDKKTLHGHIKTFNRPFRTGLPSLENVLAITDTDLSILDIVSSPTTTCSSSTVRCPSPCPILASIDNIESGDWDIPTGMNPSSSDLDVMVDGLVKDDNLMMSLLTSLIHENIQLHEV
ncbi:hypothetical protein PENTCL1PPCAC_11326, partial [Pristionchus entomophagus]